MVRGLHTVINVLGRWLKTQGWDNLHSAGCLSIEGNRVPLMGHVMAEPQVSGIFALQEVTLKARTRHKVIALIPDVRG